MNILFYIGLYPNYGGTEKVTTILANYFSKNNSGWHVDILSHGSLDEYVFAEDLDSNINIFHTPVRGRKNVLCKRNIDYIDNLVKDHRIDVLIFQDNYWLDCRMLTILKNSNKFLRIIAVEHFAPDSFVSMKAYKSALSSNIFKRKIFHKFYMWTKKYHNNRRHSFLYSICDDYVLLSPSFQSKLVELANLKDESKLHVINNPLTIKISGDTYIQKEKICLFVGRFSEQKGLFYLLDIWKRIELTHNDWKLLLVGTGILDSLLKKYVKDHAINNVFFEGYKDNPLDYYRRASIICLTSIYEGLPLVLAEAMNYRVIPVAFNSFTSAVDLIDDGENGFLIKPFDMDDYVQKLLSLMNDKMLRQRMSDAAYLKSLQCLMPSINEKWKKLIQ